MEFNYSHDPCTSNETACDDKEKVAKLLYLLDHYFLISDEAYHEISIISKELPPLYKVKQLRKDIDATVNITRIKGDIPGAYRPFKQFLQQTIKQQVSACSKKPHNY